MATGMGFVVMGFIGFFVKVLPVLHIIAGVAVVKSAQYFYVAST